MTVKTAAALALALLAAVPLAAQEKRPAHGQILILGTYHMANPGRDLYNTQADDVLAPKRQAELAQLIEVLKRFAPTKIAIERDPFDSRTKKDYDDYLAGKHELTRNEIEQIGYRLGKELGHKAIYAVDADGEFPYARLVKFAKATGREKEFESLSGEIGEMVKKSNAFMASHTVLETLLDLNSDERTAEAVGYYFRQAEYSEPYDWAGADLVADWYRRNMRIYGNVVPLAASPDERILLIYGSGHLGWLRQIFGANPNFRVRKLAEFVR
ncbi:MAG TPA: DUF5694 domain-containing protein [Thermoanaerobaculia bacterium]|jgi:hypothetical protein